MKPSTLTAYRWELRKLISQKRTYLGLGAAAQSVPGADPDPKHRQPGRDRIGVPFPDRLVHVSAGWHGDTARWAGERHQAVDPAQSEHPLLATVAVVANHVPPAVPVDHAPRLQIPA